MASKLFDTAFFSGVSSGSPYQRCGFCGITHVANLEALDEEEEKELRAEIKKNPEKFNVDEHYDFVSWAWFNGVECVRGCECNTLDKYEEFIWDHRTQIMNYIQARLLKARDEVKEQLDMLGMG